MALVLGVAPNVPGFLGTIKVLDPSSVGSFLMHLYNYAWFVGFVVAFVIYYGVMRRVNKEEGLKSWIIPNYEIRYPKETRSAKSEP